MDEPFEDSDLLWPTTPLTEALVATLDRMEANCGGRRRFVPTGIPAIDRQIDGLPSGEVTVMGGLRGSGTTALALRIGKHVAMLDQPVLYVTTRDPIVMLTERLLADESHLASQDLQRGKVRRSDWDRVGKAVQRLSEIPISFYDHPVPSLDQLMVAAARLEREGRLGMVVIDRLQGIRGWANRRTHGRGSVIAALSSMARSLDIPVLVLARFKRNLKAQTGPYCSEDLQSNSAMEGIRHFVNLSATADSLTNPFCTTTVRIDLEYPLHATEPLWLEWDRATLELRSAPPPSVLLAANP